MTASGSTPEVLPSIQYEQTETFLLESSPVYIGTNIVGELLLEQLEEIKPDKVFIITDESVLELHASDISEKISKSISTHIVAFSGGEPVKSINTINELATQLFRNKVSKSSLVVAVGGGIVGNIAGLLAALVFRGIPFIQIPTTFLAQTDSIMSRKQAVNSEFGKNMLGTYYTPHCNIVDVSFLLTESERSIRSGLVETLKNGLIDDSKLFDFMAKKTKLLSIEDPWELEKLVRISIRSKITILKTDPSEKKRGMILEYGHTVGHAIEKIMNGTKTHGECVSIGMVIAAEIARILGLLEDSHVELHKEALYNLKMPITLFKGLDPASILQTIEHDNKREYDGVKYVLLEDIGSVKIHEGNYMIPVNGKIVETALRRMA
ncbi:MAG: iron-containing alcohol dehydrogenase [Thermoleophilia bacterium]